MDRLPGAARPGEVISSVEAVASTGESAVGDHRFGGDEVPVGVGAAFGLVMGTILLSNWIFRDDLADVDEEALVDGIVSVVIQGLSNEQPVHIERGGA